MRLQTLLLAGVMGTLVACSPEVETAQTEDNASVDTVKDDVRDSVSSQLAQLPDDVITDENELAEPFTKSFDVSVFEGVEVDESIHSDVIQHRNGLQYIVLKSGEGTIEPSPSDDVVVNYEGRLASDASKFDASADHGGPAEFQPRFLIPGWQQALKHMRSGDSWIVFVPSDLGYGKRGSGAAIPPNSDLVFKLDLLEVKRELGVFEEYIPWDSERKDIVSLDEGVEYIVLESGDESGNSPAPTDLAVVDYEGRLAESGSKFDSSYDRGQPASFSPQGVIRGWQIALSKMRPGDDWIIHIPSDVAYGESGAGGVIGPNADLVFRVNLHDVIVPPKANEEAWASFTPWDKDAEGVRTSEHGWQYVILKEGENDGETADEDDFVVAHFEARLAADGKVIGSSFPNIDPARFTAKGGELEALDQVFMSMKPGEEWLIHVPYDLAYGEEGRSPLIPAKADLMFEVRMIDVLRQDATGEAVE